MPKIVLISENRKLIEQIFRQKLDPKVKGVVCVECEYIPERGDEVQVAEEVNQKYCIRCGYHRDAEKRHLQMMCFNPKSPYLKHIKKTVQTISSSKQQ